MKIIEGYNETYSISPNGLVCNVNTGRVMKQCTVNGYKRVTLTNGSAKRHHRIHRLVAEYYLPNPLGLHDVNHIDEDKTNNVLSNLQWMSRQDNTTKSSDRMRGKSAKVPIKIDGVVFPSLLEGAKYFVTLYPSKKITTIRREFRRIISGDRAEGLMYGHSVEKLK